MMLVRPFRLTKHQKKQLAVTTILIATFATILLTLFQMLPMPRFVIKMYYWAKPEKSVFCHYFRTDDDHDQSLPDIMDHKPRSGQRSIFFHETSCNSYLNGRITINARQACAVESAARMNPQFDVYLLYLAPGRFDFRNSESDRFLKELMRYDNVNILHVNLERYMNGTPVEQLWTNGNMRWSSFAMEHTSDVLRFLTLWKFGGIYLDLDVIITKNLLDLGLDFTGVESSISAAVGVIGFNSTGKGHEFVTACLEDLNRNFRGDIWGWNGPGTITRFLKKECQVSTVDKMIGKTCNGFKVYSVDKFYAIPWDEWKVFFDPNRLKEVRDHTKESYLIHVWNKYSRAIKIDKHSDGIPYFEFAKSFCPNIVKQCDSYF